MKRANHHHGTEASFSRDSVPNIDSVVPLLILLDAVNLGIIATVTLHSHGGYNNHVGGKVDIRTRWRWKHQHVSLISEITKVCLIVYDPIISLPEAAHLRPENRFE